MKEIIFATYNEDKLKEITTIMAGMSSRLISVKNAGYDIEIIEDGTTYIENATKKARAILELSGKPTMSDDSGVEIDFLGGEPGLNASTYLTTNDNYKERNKKILEMLADATGAQRKAAYVCTIALFLPNGDKYFTEGRLEGEIATEPKGSDGFAYDEIFYIPHLGKTLAELSIQEKNKISHRNIALQKMLKILKEFGL